jgi:hypothetical protein
LRSLIYVGAKAGRLATIAEIAEAFDVSKRVRERGGGISLARPAAKIRVFRPKGDDNMVRPFMVWPSGCSAHSARHREPVTDKDISIALGYIPCKPRLRGC